MLNQWRKKQSFKVKDDVAGVSNTRNSQQCSHLIGDAVLHVRAEDQPDVISLSCCYLCRETLVVVISTQMQTGSDLLTPY